MREKSQHIDWDFAQLSRNLFSRTANIPLAKFKLSVASLPELIILRARARGLCWRRKPFCAFRIRARMCPPGAGFNGYECERTKRATVQRMTMSRPTRAPLAIRMSEILRRIVAPFLSSPLSLLPHRQRKHHYTPELFTYAPRLLSLNYNSNLTISSRIRTFDFHPVSPFAFHLQLCGSTVDRSQTCLHARERFDGFSASLLLFNLFYHFVKIIIDWMQLWCIIVIICPFGIFKSIL